VGGLFGRDGPQHRTDFIAFKVIHWAGWSALNGYSQYALGFFDLFGITRGEEPRKSVNGGQPGISRGPTMTLFTGS
jgi:hypothetical protein